VKKNLRGRPTEVPKWLLFLPRGYKIYFKKTKREKSFTNGKKWAGGAPCIFIGNQKCVLRRGFYTHLIRGTKKNKKGVKYFGKFLGDIIFYVWKSKLLAGNGINQLRHFSFICRSVKL